MILNLFTTNDNELAYSATCPYGTESNYAVYSHTNSCADVALGQFLMSLTFIAFNAVVIAMLPAWIGVAASVAEATFTYFVDNDPYSTGASYRDYRYTHYTKGWWVSDTLAVQKCSIYLYSNANYTGSNSHKTVYYSHEFTG